MSIYINAEELHNQGWVAARYINWEPTPLNYNFRLEVEVKPFITFPAADVAEVKHGRWKQVGDNTYRCSVCGELSCCCSPYCGECGAKMDEECEDEHR